MAGDTSPLETSEWRRATVVEVIRETATARSLVLDVPGWAGHRAGQHLSLRLPGGDHVHVERRYSIASAPEDGFVVLTVERVHRGRLSTYLTNRVQIDDIVELRGPLGDHFVWNCCVSPPTTNSMCG